MKTRRISISQYIGTVLIFMLLLAAAVTAIIGGREGEAAFAFNESGYRRVPAATAEPYAEPLTLTVIPDAQLITYGESISQTAYSITGFAASDDERLIEGEIKLVASRTAAGVGQISVDTTGVTAPGYDILGEQAALTINKKRITITGIEAVDRVYDETVHITFRGGTLHGVLGGDDVSFTAVGALAGENPSLAAGAGALKAVDIEITLKGADASNYVLSALPVMTVNIAKAETHIGVSGLHVKYDKMGHRIIAYASSGAALTYSVENSFIKPGTYTVTISAPETANHLAASVTVTMTIERTPNLILLWIMMSLGFALLVIAFVLCFAVKKQNSGHIS